MFRSVFSKYFMILACLLTGAILGLGIVQMIFFNNYWIEEKRTQLTDNATQIAAHVTDTTKQSTREPTSYVIPAPLVQPAVDLMATSTQTTILITNTDGQILLMSEGASVIGQGVPDQTLSRFAADYFAVDTMNGLFASMHYTAATPIITDSNQLIGYVITAMPADGLMTYLAETSKTYFMSAIIVLLVLFIVCYLLTYRLVQPLREMATATRRFAEGDFSYRVKVKGKDEVAELAAALNNMAVSLSSTENMSRSFVANVSHELKTPMTTISGFVDGILDGTIPPERHDHYLHIVSDEVKRLSRLVKSMLEMSRIEDGTVSLRPKTFDLTDTACSALLSFEKRIEEKRVNITGLSECERTMVTADYDLIGQVVYNLLDNAVKFVNTDGEIGVRIYHEHDRTYCAIRNSGAGLAPEEMPRVFERFYKTDRSRSLDKSGVGLGLYIVKTVINLHHGEIHVRSVQGEYCEFEFWLPDVGGEVSRPDRNAPKLSSRHE